jgi:hypothetical protein
MALTAGAYLIVAYYNRSKWNSLTQVQQDTAHHAAEKWIPERPDDPKDPDLTYPVVGPDRSREAPRILQTFASDIFQMQDSPAYRAMNDDEKTRYVNGIYATEPPKPPVGWMEIIEAQELPAFIHNMAPFWKMYDVEFFELPADWTDSHPDIRALPPLNNDLTTHEVYDFMTPRNWT